jgi:hypothetical protein
MAIPHPDESALLRSRSDATEQLTFNHSELYFKNLSTNLPSTFNANCDKSASCALMRVALLMSYSSTLIEPRTSPAVNSSTDERCAKGKK